MKEKTIIKLITIVIIAYTILFTGCVENKNPNEITQSAALTTKEPSELALMLSDFTSNYTIKDRSERVKSDVSKEAFNLGWKKGYYSKYTKNSDNLFDVTIIEQFISIYPPENISNVFAILPRESNENRTIDKLSNPGIGDESRAYRITTKNKLGADEKIYMIEFIKFDVYEQFVLYGTTIDCELLKTLAKKAENKIE